MGPRYHRVMRALLLAGLVGVGLEDSRLVARAADGVLPHARRAGDARVRAPAVRRSADSHRRRRDAPRVVARASGTVRPGPLLPRQRRQPLDVARRRRRAAAAWLQRPGGRLPWVRRQHGPSDRAWRVSGCGRGGAPLQRASPAPRQSRDLLGPIARQRRGGVGRVTRRLRCPRAGESLSGHASGLCREPGDAAADRVFVVPISHLEVHRTIRAAAARHPRRRRFDHPVRGRQTRVRPRAGRPKDADHDSACRPQRSARGESGDVLAGDRRVRRVPCKRPIAR